MLLHSPILLAKLLSFFLPLDPFFLLPFAMPFWPQTLILLFVEEVTFSILSKSFGLVVTRRVGVK